MMNLRKQWHGVVMRVHSVQQTAFATIMESALKLFYYLKL